MAYYYDPNQGYYFNPSGASQGTSGGPEGTGASGGDNAYGAPQGSYENGDTGGGYSGRGYGGDGYSGGSNGAGAYGGGYAYGAPQGSYGDGSVYNDAQRANGGSSNAVNRGTSGVSAESGERVSLRGPSGSSRSSGNGRSSSGSSGSGARTSAGSGTSGSARSGSEDRRSSAGNRSGSTGKRSGASGNGNRPRRRKKVTWQRKVKRFFRRLIRTLSRLPQEMLVLLAAAVVIVVILVVLIVRALLPSGSRQETSSSSSAMTESDASEESDASGSTEDAGDGDETSTDAESGEVTTADLLQGLDNYTITTDENEVTELTSSLTATVPSSCTASSVLTTSSGISYAADNLFDSDLTTSWQEGEDDEGVGVTITSTFASGTELSAIVIWSGNETTEDKFNNNNRPAQITISVSSDSQSYSAVYTLEDYMGAQAIVFEEPVPVESVVIRIDSVYEGEVYNDTVISELAFLTQ